MISPASLAGGGLRASTLVFEPPSPTLPPSMPTSPVAFKSSGFFFAAMVDFRLGERVVGEVHRAVSAERDSLVQSADGGARPHSHRYDLLDRDRATLLDLHRRLEGMRVEGVEIFLAATVQPHRVRIDALLNGGVRYLLDQDADLQDKASLGVILRSSRGAILTPASG